MYKLWELRWAGARRKMTANWNLSSRRLGVPPLEASSLHCYLAAFLFIHIHICSAPHLQMGPKRFTLATIALFSAVCAILCVLFSLSLCALVVCDSKWATVAFYTAHFEYNYNGPKWLQRCLVVTWLVPRETAAVSAHVLCRLYNHARVYSVTLFEATLHRMCTACVFSCNQPPTLLAEWPGKRVNVLLQ